MLSLVAWQRGYAPEEGGERMEAGKPARKAKATEEKSPRREKPQAAAAPSPSRETSLWKRRPRTTTHKNKQAPLARTPTGLVHLPTDQFPRLGGEEKGGSAAGWGGRLGRGVPQPAAATRVSIGIQARRMAYTKAGASRELGSYSQVGVPPPQLGAFGFDTSSFAGACKKNKRPLGGRSYQQIISAFPRAAAVDSSSAQSATHSSPLLRVEA